MPIRLAVLLAFQSPEKESAPSLSVCRPLMVEPLSPREQAVLRYLPTMMSNQEIASELFVSVNTVKTHLKAIYRKVGVSSQRELIEWVRVLAPA